MTTSTFSIQEVGRKAQDLASELRSTGVLNSDSYYKMQELLKTGLTESAVTEGSENPEIWKLNCEELLKTLNEYSKLMDQYHHSTNNSSMKKKVEELERKVDDLKKEVRELQQKLRELEGSREKRLKSFGKELGELRKAIKMPATKVSDHVLVGQLAYKAEKAIVDYVLTKVIGPPQRQYIKSLANLQQALNREQNFTQPLNDEIKCAEAKKRWEELQKQIGWQERHYRCIEFFKAAHCVHTTVPEFDISVLREAVNEYEAFPHKSECEELLGMIDTIDQQL